MGPEKKREVIELVRRSPVAKKHTLTGLGLAAREGAGSRKTCN